MCVVYMCTCVKETAPPDIITFRNFGSVIKSVLDCTCTLGMKHREERVVGGEVKPTSSMFGEEGEECLQVLYDKVSPLVPTHPLQDYYVIIYYNRGLLVNKCPWWRTVWP